jgi:hypothetical protein
MAMALADLAAEDAARSRLCVDRGERSKMLADGREPENVCCPSVVLELVCQDEHREHHGHQVQRGKSVCWKVSPVPGMDQAVAGYDQTKDPLVEGDRLEGCDLLRQHLHADRVLWM